MWEIVLYANSLFILDWAKPTTVPMIKENRELTNNKFFIASYVCLVLNSTFN